VADIALQEIRPARDIEPQRLACPEPRGTGRETERGEIAIDTGYPEPLRPGEASS
jgi:hypothetical protein